MNCLRIKLTVSLIFCISNLIIAQQINNYNSEEQPIDLKVIELEKSSSKFKTRNLDTEVDGSPYICDSFNPAYIKQYKDKIYSARFNAYNGEMEITVNNKIMALDVNSDIEITFSLLNKTYKSVKYPTDKGESRNEFLVLLVENEKLSLYKKECIMFYEKVQAITGYNKEKKARFERAKDKYYIKQEGNIISFPQRKSKILKLFPKYNKEINTYLKLNKIDLKNEDNLIATIEYLNTIIE